MALEDGVRYRDSLAKMIEIRDKEQGYRAQEEALAMSGGGVKAVSPAPPGHSSRQSSTRNSTLQ